MVNPSSTTFRATPGPDSKPDSRKLFRRATERLKKVLSFDVAALVVADSTHPQGPTEIWVTRRVQGRDVCERKILQQRLDGEFRLVGGQLIAVSGSKITHDVSFIERIVGIDTRALKSGLLVPLPDHHGSSVMLFLGSFNNGLLQARKTISLAEIHAVVAPNAKNTASSKPHLSARRSATVKEQEKFYRKIFEGIDLPAAVLENDFTILKVNSSFEKALGYSREHVEGQRTLRDLVSPSERRQIFRPRENRTNLRIEARLTLRNGAERTFEVALRRQANSSLRIATFRDVSTIHESATELRERADRLVVIQAVGEAVNAAMSVEEIFVRLVKQLRHVAQFEYAGLAFHNPATQAIRLEAVFKDGKFSLGKSEMPLNKFSRLVGAAAGIQERLPDSLMAFLGVEKSVSIAALVISGKIQHAERHRPSRRQAEAVGCLVLASEYPRAFSQFHMRVLESVGDLLGAGIRKVQLWRQAQENFDRLSLLSEASRDIGNSLDLDRVLNSVVDAAKKTLNATAAVVCLVNEKGVCEHAVAGVPEAEWIWPGMDAQAMLSGIKADEIISVSDIRRSPFFSKQCKKLLLQKGLKAFLGAAIVVDQKPVAVLGVFAEEASKLRGGAGSILSALAAQTARVLQNARLFQEVTETKNYLENLLKSSVDAIVTTDRAGCITYFSPGAEQMLGVAAETAMGRKISDFLYTLSDTRQLFRQVMREGKAQSYECDVSHGDGGKVPTSLSLSQVRNDTGRLAGFLAIGKDISARKTAELESTRRGVELENYIYLISHNLKTPIVSIQGFVNLLIDEIGSSLNQQQKHFLDRIQKNAAMMEKMIVDLLDFSRMARPQFNLRLTRIQEIVNNVVDEMKSFDNMRTVEFDIAQNLPEVIADAEAVQIVFENLISNAAKYRRPGVPAKIKVGWESHPRFYAFYIQDNGIGFDAGFKEKAFALFQRGPNTGQIPGTGVGLALVKRIIENHQGLVRIESTPDVGTTVHFTIPKELRREN